MSSAGKIMRFGPGGLPVGYTWASVFPFLSELGLSAFEVEFVRGVNMSQATAKSVKESADQNNIKLSIHAPYYLNLCGNDLVIEKSKKHMFDCAKIADTLDARIIFHAGFYIGQSPDAAFEKVEKSMLQIAKNTNAVFAVETMGKQKQFGTLEEALSLSDTFPTVVPCIDWAHLHARSFGSLKTENDFEKILSLIKKSKRNYLANLQQHFSSIFFTNGNERNHLPLSEKQPDFSILCNVLKQWGVNGTVISETPVPIDGAVEMLKVWGK